jgi:hypothetical protein
MIGDPGRREVLRRHALAGNGGASLAAARELREEPTPRLRETPVSAHTIGLGPGLVDPRKRVLDLNDAGSKRQRAALDRQCSRGLRQNVQLRSAPHSMSTI